MSNLPRGWATCEVDQVFKSFSGGTPSKSNSAYWGGSIPWLSSGDIKTERTRTSAHTITAAGLENSSARLCQPGAVLVVVRSGILKHTLPVTLLEHEAAINQDIKCFDSGDDNLNRWLALALRTSARDILALNREGTTVQSVKYETLKSFELCLPPVAEQQRIVAKLDELLGKAGACQNRLARIPALLKRFRQSVLAAACSGRLTEDWRGENDQEYEWPTKELAEVGQVTGGVTKNAKRGTMDMQVPYLRVANVYENRLELGDVHEIGVTTQEFERVRLVKGDVLFVEGNGSLDQIGRVALWDGSISRCVHQNHLIKFRAGSEVLPEYVLLQMMAPLGRSQLMEKATSSAGLNTLSISKISAVRFPIPSVTEQREIVRRARQFFVLADQIETRLAGAMAQVNRLTPSLLAKAFRGELVPTEAELAEQEGREYETAQQLVARISRQSTEVTPQAPMSPKKMTAIIATTNKLPNGFAHTRQDLEDLQEQIMRVVGTPQAIFYRDHRPDLGPRGEITRAWVDRLERDPKHYAVFCELEYGSDADIAGSTGLSISFFSGRKFGVGDQSRPQITIGAPPGLFTDVEAKDFLREIAKTAGNGSAIYRDFYAHDFASLTMGAVVFILTASAAGLVGGAAYDLAKGIVKRLKGNRAGLVGRIQVRAETAHGRVEVFIPADLPSKRLQTVLVEAFKSIQQHDRDERRTFSLSIQVDTKGYVTKRETPDQPPA